MTDRRAILLAAGMGTRLVAGEDYPKPMKPVAGVPLLVRALRALDAIGVKEAGIVVGYRQDVIRKALASQTFGLDITFFDNDEYEKSNGTSVLKAASFVEESTFLLMSDHLCSPKLLAAVGAFPLGERQAVLGIDKRVDRCYDMDDATKVLTRGDEIARIGKSIPEYDAIDTGVFRITPALIEALSAVNGPEGCTLSQGVQVLADRGDMRVVDVGGAAWIDVDTPLAHRIAEELIARFGEHLDVPLELTAKELGGI